jgi:hypothetical protein
MLRYAVLLLQKLQFLALAVVAEALNKLIQKKMLFAIRMNPFKVPMTKKCGEEWDTAAVLLPICDHRELNFCAAQFSSI